MTFDHIATFVAAKNMLPEDEHQQYQFAVEYIILLFIADIYSNYLESETQKENPTDINLSRIFRILKLSNDSIDAFTKDKIIPALSVGLKGVFLRAFNQPYSHQGVFRRIDAFRNAFLRTPSSKLRPVFNINNPRDYLNINKSVQASLMDDPKESIAAIQHIVIHTSVIRMMINKISQSILKDKYTLTPTINNTIPHITQETLELAQTIQQKENTPVDTPDYKDLLEKTSDLNNKIKNVTNIAIDKDHPATKTDVVELATNIVANHSPIKAFSHLEPDSEQKEAIFTSGRVLVVAGAGSGKTATLTSKVGYLIKDKQVDPSTIFVTTFAKDAAAEMQERIKTQVGDYPDMYVGTMHSFGLNTLKQYGSPEYKQAIENSQRQKNPYQLDRLIKSAMEEVKEATGQEVSLSAKDIGLIISNWKYVLVEPDEVLDHINKFGKDDPNYSMDELLEAAKVYRVFETLKGRYKIMHKPPYYQGKTKGWDKRVTRVGNTPLINFDDMLCDLLRLLKEKPEVLNIIQKRYQHYIMDESQDSNAAQFEIFDLITKNIPKDGDAWLVGDPNQCVDGETEVIISSGSKFVKDIVVGDQILSYRNQKVVYQTVEKIWKTEWTFGVKITTESGKTLLMSPNHKIWSGDIKLEAEQKLICLMYQEKMGYRIGVLPLISPEAEKLWVLNVCNDNDDALLTELSILLNYVIPTCAFKGEGCETQERLNNIFKSFGHNGEKLLSDYHLSFDLPYWQACNSDKKVLNIVSQNQELSYWYMDYVNDEYAYLYDHLCDESFVLEKTQDDKKRIVKHNNNYKELVEQAQKIAHLLNLSIIDKMCFGDEYLTLKTASSLFPTMSIPVLNDNNVILEKIVSVEKVGGEFYDVEVDDSCNFFGNGILSHNSIYRFRGARPEEFLKFANDPAWKIKKIRTNYRCGSKIVQYANALISHNKDRIPMDAIPSRKNEGIISLKRNSIESMANETIDDIKNSQTVEAKQFDDFSVIARTNNALNDFEAACIVGHVPYTRRGGINFFNRREIKMILGYMMMAISDDIKEVNAAIEEVYDYPNRFLGAKFGIALKNYNNYFEALIEPSLLQGFSYQTDLIKKFHTDIINLKNVAKTNTTLDLLEEILDVSGNKKETIRSYIEVDVRDEEEEGEKEHIQLGGISYLIKMMSKDPRFPGIDPSNPKEFFIKIKQMKELMKGLNVKEGGVVLSTIHAAKGLQYHKVFAVMQPPNKFIDTDEKMEEERRMAYVQITRAQNELTILSPKYDIKGKKLPTSRFIEEAGFDSDEDKMVTAEQDDDGSRQITANQINKILNGAC